MWNRCSPQLPVLPWESEIYMERESIACLSTRGGGVGQMIWRFMLGRLLLLLMLSISSSASVVVLLHSQGGGGDIEQSHGVELAGGLVGLELLVIREVTK